MSTTTPAPSPRYEHVALTQGQPFSKEYELADPLTASGRVYTWVVHCSNSPDILLEVPAAKSNTTVTATLTDPQIENLVFLARSLAGGCADPLRPLNTDEPTRCFVLGQYLYSDSPDGDQVIESVGPLQVCLDIDTFADPWIPVPGTKPGGPGTVTPGGKLREFGVSFIYEPGQDTVFPFHPQGPAGNLSPTPGPDGLYHPLPSAPEGYKPVSTAPLGYYPKGTLVSRSGSSSHFLAGTDLTADPSSGAIPAPRAASAPADAPQQTDSNQATTDGDTPSAPGDGALDPETTAPAPAPEGVPGDA